MLRVEGMKRFVATILCLAAFSASSAVLTAEQNGSQKKRYVVTVEGTNCWAQMVGTAPRAVRADAPWARPSPCAAVPVMPPAGATLQPVGDQHLVLKGADGKPLCYYHLVTDRWVMADKVKVRKGFGVWRGAFSRRISC